MARVKGGFTSRRRRKKVLKRAAGYYGANSRLFSVAHEKNDRAMVYAYRDRKVRKREFRQLWTQRINAAARINGTTYSVLMGAMAKSGLEINRKALAEMAIHDEAGFTALLKNVLKQASA